MRDRLLILLKKSWPGILLSALLFLYALTSLPGSRLVGLIALIPAILALGWTSYTYIMQTIAEMRERTLNTVIGVANLNTAGVAVIGANSVIQYANQTVVDLAGSSLQEVIGKSFWLVLKSTSFSDAVRKGLQSGEPQTHIPVTVGNTGIRSDLIPVKQGRQITDLVVRIYADRPFSYEYRDAPLPRPMSSVSFPSAISWFFEIPKPQDPHINPVALKCRSDPAYAGSVGIVGATEPDTGEALYALTRLINPRNVIEVGAYNGASSITISQALKDNGGHGKLYSVEISETNFALTGKHLAEAGLSDFVQQVFGNSTDPQVVQSLPQSEFIFIDGDHSYEGAKRDFELYSPLLSDKGIMLYHDTIKIMALRRLMQEVAESGAFLTLTIASSDGDGITLIRRREG